jgi:hypothetical protein
MMHKILSIAGCLGALALGLAQPAAAAPIVIAQAAAPSDATTAAFTTFLTDILAGRVPPNISQMMRSQSSAMLAQVKSTFASLGAFRKLQFLREESEQGYHRYHYTAVFEKGTKALAFVTDSNGTIVGFFEDQPNH